MNLSVGDRVRFGPPGSPKATGEVVRLRVKGGSKTRIRQIGAAHGQPAGTEWNVPTTPQYIEPLAPVFGGAAARGSVPVSEGGRYHPPRRGSTPPPSPPRRTSRPARPPARAEHQPEPQTGPAARGPTETWAVSETKALLHKWNVPPFRIKFTNAMTKVLGKVNYRIRTISYSRPLWNRASDEQRREVVIHEVAHAVVENREGRVPGTSHGASWKRQMIAMGIHDPSAYHKVDRTGLKRKRGDTVELVCCGRGSFRVTLAKLARTLDSRGGIRMRCRACAEAPKFATSEDEARLREFVHRGHPLARNQLCGCHADG